MGTERPTSTENVDALLPAQCRAARALLDINQQELARLADLGLSTVVDFERSRRVVSNDAIRSMRAALEGCGIEFLDENGGGPGLRLRQGPHEKEK
ncbi:hypothetical protein CCR97_18540 [Rhodoplanes elegans]|uniref:HTH cro/C1-type domain-containing protein n=1 Tax=Rhodoplanes elegans TaxID=29408 RepID=A0A327K1R9_9BRAD|nr:hypothetical protein [Rhodoplanes elegans]RAI31242.1 hypothetical protein CH338_26165 [Rhodoplanes elegans]